MRGNIRCTSASAIAMVKILFDGIVKKINKPFSWERRRRRREAQGEVSSSVRFASAAAMAVLAWTASIAEAQARSQFDVPPQPLADSLRSVGSQANVNVLFDPRLVADHQAPALKGEFTTDQAFTLLLHGTGIKHDYVNDRTIVLASAQPTPSRGAEREGEVLRGRDRRGGKGDADGEGEASRFWKRFRLAQAETTTSDASSASTNTPSSVTDSTGRVIDEVIVTAQKRAESALNVPMSISAITDKAMKDAGVTQLADFIDRVPGVSILDSGSGTQSISIRGISATFGDAPVGYYLDELPFTLLQNTPVIDVRTFDLERVEVLRGPQGTLYGDGSIGGTIRILTKDPKLNEYQAEVDLTGMDTTDGTDSYAGKGMLNVPLKDDMFALRVVASKENLGGWVDNLFSGVKDDNERDIDNYRAKLRVAPTGALDIVVSAWHTKEDTVSSAERLPNGTKPFDSSAGALEYDLYSATVRYELAAADLVSATSWMDHSLNSLGTILGLPLSVQDNQDILSEELRLVSNGDGPFRWTAGLFYREIERAVSFEVATVRGNDSGESASWAIYGEGTWSFLDDTLDVTLGLRYFEDVRRTTSQLDPALVALVQMLDPDFTGRFAEQRFDTTNPRLNIAYHANDEWMLYANVAKGFRSGQPQAVISLIQAVFNGVDVPLAIDPETLWSFELGTKGSLSGGRVILEGAAYYNDWDNLQNNVAVATVPVQVFALANAGRARTLGVELSATLQPVEGLTVQLTGSRLEAQYADDVPASNIRDGDPISVVPENMLSAVVTYRRPLSAALGLFAHGNARYTSELVDVVNRREPSDDVIALGARVGVESGSWAAYLFGENLTDENGALSPWFAASGGYALRMRPRTFGLNLRYSFN